MMRKLSKRWTKKGIFKGSPAGWPRLEQAAVVAGCGQRRALASWCQEHWLERTAVVAGCGQCGALAKLVTCIKLTSVHFSVKILWYSAVYCRTSTTIVLYS